MTRSIFDEHVRGTVIGPVTFPYEFWTIYKNGASRYGTRRIDRGHFESDEAAIAWFKGKYPDEFRDGVEMKVFDRP